jgi:hypothetical protein
MEKARLPQQQSREANFVALEILGQELVAVEGNVLGAAAP